MMRMSTTETLMPYRVGEVYVAALPDLKEVEIEDVLPAAQIIKLKGEGWLDCGAFEGAVRARIGRAVYSQGLIGLTRKIIRET